MLAFEINKIEDILKDMRSDLDKAVLPYSDALQIDASMGALVRVGERTLELHKAEVHRLTTVIEGLVANWPEVDVAAHYAIVREGAAPVLVKEAAIERALEVIKGCNREQQNQGRAG